MLIIVVLMFYPQISNSKYNNYQQTVSIVCLENGFHKTITRKNTIKECHIRNSKYRYHLKYETSGDQQNTIETI